MHLTSMHLLVPRSVVPEAANATLIRRADESEDPLSLMLCCGLARSSIARRGISLALRARMCKSESEPYEASAISRQAQSTLREGGFAESLLLLPGREGSPGNLSTRKRRRLCCKYIGAKGDRKLCDNSLYFPRDLKCIHDRCILFFS